MTGLFTTFFRQQLFANQALMANAPLALVFFPSSPLFTVSDSRYTGIRTVADLAGVLGWGTPLSPQSGTLTVGTLTQGNSVYVIANNPFPLGGGWVNHGATAAAVVYQGTLGGVVNPVLYLTDTAFIGNMVLNVGDAYGAVPATVVAGNRVLFSWPRPAAGAPTIIPVEGGASIIKAAPSFELSHQQHIWLHPQRVNLLANPSFEGGVTHWRTNGTASRVNVGAPNGPGVWSGQFAGTSPVVAESNQFPLLIETAINSLWTIQLMAKGTGPLKVGLLSWEPDFSVTSVDWGPGTGETFNLVPDAYTHIQAMRRSAESTTGMVRLECNGTSLTVDNLVCEPDHLRDWPYFDGDTLYGARDDFSWYGGANLKGKTYSLWYNHRRAVVGRLFAWDIDQDDLVVTDEEVEAQGFVYGWVPAGVRVQVHMDVLWEGDIQTPPVDVAGQAVTAYSVGPSDPLGVANPWPDVTAPVAPTTLTATATSGTQAHLSWGASSDPSGITYLIERNSVQIGTVSAPTVAYDDAGLTAGTTYTYRVRAQDGAGNLSPYSNTVSVTPVNDLLLEKFNNYTTAPWVTTAGAPTITASGRTGNAAQLTNPSDAIKYTIPAVSESDTITIGFGYKTSALGSENDILVLSSDAGATDHNKLRVNSAGSLVFYRGASGLWTSAAGVVVANTWLYIEVKVKLSDTVGTLNVRSNGTSLTSQTALDTKNAGTKTTYDTIKLDTVWVINYYDDLYVTMGASAAFKGPISLT
jgi:hypothetical protein